MSNVTQYSTLRISSPTQQGFESGYNFGHVQFCDIQVMYMDEGNSNTVTKKERKTIAFSLVPTTKMKKESWNYRVCYWVIKKQITVL